MQLHRDQRARFCDPDDHRSVRDFGLACYADSHKSGCFDGPGMRENRQPVGFVIGKLAELGVSDVDDVDCTMPADVLIQTPAGPALLAPAASSTST
jgi:hypothetical protein